MKVRLGQRLMRAMFVSLGVGMFGGLGIYILSMAVNMIAGEVVIDPIAFLLIVLGGAIFTGIGVEWSADIEAKQAEDKGKP